MRITRKITIPAILAMLGACGADTGSSGQTDGQGQPVVGPPTQSQCLSAQGADASPTIEVSVNGDTVRIVDRHAVFNCCLEAWMEVAVVGNDISVVEVEDPDKTDACYCVCPFELSIEVSNLAAGTYSISVYRDLASTASLLYAQEVQIAASTQPIIGATWQSACLGSGYSAKSIDCGPMEAELEDFSCYLAWGYKWDGTSCVAMNGACQCNGADCDALFASESECSSAYADCATTGQSSGVEIQAGTGQLLIIDHELVGNCCLEYEMDVSIQGNDIVVVETELPGSLCYCMCTYEASVGISALESGDYDVVIYRYTLSPETLIHSETVTVN